MEVLPHGLWPPGGEAKWKLARYESLRKDFTQLIRGWLGVQDLGGEVQEDQPLDAVKDTLRSCDSCG